MNKNIGATLLITGTAIGAGMLALPLVSGSSGLIIALPLLIIIWLLMTYTGLLILEANLHFPALHNSFGTMAEKTLGSTGKVITWASYLLLLYSLVGAYINGDNSLINLLLSQTINITLPSSISAIIFTVIFGSVIWWSTQCVDYANRYLLSIKGLSLIISIALLLPDIHTNFLATTTLSHQTLAITPIFLTAFGYHHIIPSLRNYIGDHPQQLKKVIITGTTIPFIIYSLWLIATLGTLPQSGPYSFQALNEAHNNIQLFIANIIHMTHSKPLHFCIELFANIAVTTSFLGVSLGLFDFLADGFKRKNNKKGRLQTACLTFIPPLLFAIGYPDGFLIALSCAALFVIILEVILPSLIVFQLRYHKKVTLPYQAIGSKLAIVGVTAIGALLMVLQILAWIFS